MFFVSVTDLLEGFIAFALFEVSGDFGLAVAPGCC
jgi:hypothetical protein